jgi:hypothetical protein
VSRRWFSSRTGEKGCKPPQSAPSASTTPRTLHYRRGGVWRGDVTLHAEACSNAQRCSTCLVGVLIFCIEQVLVDGSIAHPRARASAPWGRGGCQRRTRLAAQGRPGHRACEGLSDPYTRICHGLTPQFTPFFGCFALFAGCFALFHGFCRWAFTGFAIVSRMFCV